MWFAYLARMHPGSLHMLFLGPVQSGGYPGEDQGHAEETVPCLVWEYLGVLLEVLEEVAMEKDA